MQVFSEPEISQMDSNDMSGELERRNSYEVSQMGDNTYATILPRNMTHMGPMANGSANELNGTVRSLRMASNNGLSTIGNGEIADYATLRNVSRVPPAVSCLDSEFPVSRFTSSFGPFDAYERVYPFQLFEFTGSSFQALNQNADGDYTAEIL